MDELLEQFLVEGRDLVAQALADFATLSDNAHDSSAIDSAFRAVHTLKGSVGIFALTPAEHVLHAAEDLLALARKDGRSLGSAGLTALISCLDQTDRWIDEVERSGSLGADAEQIALRICSQLVLGGASPAPSPGAAKTEATSWTTELILRQTKVFAAATGPLTAFRYEPDPDCFFRGDDPLSVVADVPELLALDILPVGGSWPNAEAFEPFVCVSILEGLSAAPENVVRAAFRLMPDQIILTTLAGADEAASKDDRDLKAKTLRVDVTRLTDLADGFGELLVVVNSLTSIARQAESIDRELSSGIRAAFDNLNRVGAKLRSTLSAIRSVPLEPALRRLPRMAREIAESTGKTVELVIKGQGIEADRQIADGLFEPLLHLLRNAIDHGIEFEAARSAAGKSVNGSITLTLRRDGEIIEASLEDDGAGIDPDRIRQVAIERGLIDEGQAATLSDTSALRLIFEPGFSTAAAVTELSGRGVGMDAVQNAVAGLRGTVDVESQLGIGTRFRMRIPANALTTRLLMVETGGNRYGIALDQVIELVRVTKEDIRPLGTGLACVLRDKTVPVLNLADLLGACDEAREGIKTDHYILIVTRSHGEALAFRVDALGERIDTLVRAPTGILASIAGISGSAVLSDGGVLLVLDLAELVA